MTKETKPSPGRVQTVSLQVEANRIGIPGADIQTNGAISASPPVVKPRPPVGK